MSTTGAFLTALAVLSASLLLIGFTLGFRGLLRRGSGN